MKTKKGDLSEGVPSADDISLKKIEDLSVHPKGTRQSRTVENVLKTDDYDRIEEENRFVVSRGTGKE